MEVFDSPTHYYPSDTLTLDELAYWIAFNRIFGIGPVNFKLLLDFFVDDIAAAWKADSKTLAQAGLGQKTIDSFLKQRAALTPQKELEKLERMRICVITWKDKNYPSLLKKIDSAPPVLYVAGTLTAADEFAVGVVGTRRMTNYGRQVTERFATDLTKGKVTVVSGLALGVDTVAHTATLPIVVFYSPYPTRTPARIAYHAWKCRSIHPTGRYRPSFLGVPPSPAPVF